MKRKTRKIWFAGGSPTGLTESDFQDRIMETCEYLSSFTRTDFVRVDKKAGSRTRIVMATDQMMWKRWRDPKDPKRLLKRVPIGLHVGTELWFTTRPRFGTPAQRLVERTFLHELGHQLGLRHTADTTSIMHIDLGAMGLNKNDIIKFLKKLGKP